MKRPWAVVSLGTAAGEAALAAAFIGAAVGRGHRVRAWTVGERYAAHLAKAGADVEPLRSMETVQGAGAQGGVVACATSLTCASLLPALGAATASVVTLESSWLPWTARAPARFARVERFLVSMPRAVFAAGLGENRGRFRIADEVLRRMVPVGWFAPTAQRGDGPPTVLVYFGRGRATPTFAGGDAIGAAIERVAARRPDVRWRYVGPPGLSLPTFVEEHPGWMDEATLTRWHADADLVVCHHGQVTIGRAAAVGARVLAMAPGTIFRPFADEDWSDFEVHAFARSGRVDAVHGPASADALARRIDALLADGRAQPDGGGGADAAVQVVEQMLRASC